MKLILFFCFLMCFEIVYSQKDISQFDKKFIIENYKNNKDELEIFYKKSVIPKSLKKYIKNKFGKYPIANPNKNFNKSDHIRNFFTPDKQLQFLIKNDNFYGLVLKKGGISVTKYFIFSEIISRKIVKVEIYNLNCKTESIEDFLECIELGKFEKNRIFDNLE